MGVGGIVLATAEDRESLSRMQWDWSELDRDRDGVYVVYGRGGGARLNQSRVE